MTDMIVPMLADKVDADRIPDFCRNGRWAAQQKIDGQRIVVHNGYDVVALQRDGLPTDIPKPVRTELRRLGLNGWFDGELVDGVLWLFDVIDVPPIVTPESTTSERLQALATIGAHMGWNTVGRAVRVVPTAWTTEEKLLLAKRVVAERAEGLIFRRLDAPYQQAVKGRRSKGLLKAKLRYDCDCVVVDRGREGKDNYTLGLYEDGTLVEVGEVTGQAGDGPRIERAIVWAAMRRLLGHPAPWPVVTVVYQYATKDRRLYGPPTMPRVRWDKTPEECTIDQLVYPHKGVLP